MSTSNLVSIRQFIHQVPYAPTQNSEVAGWQDIILLKHSLPPGEVNVPGLAENLLFMSLLPKIQYENLNDQRLKQRVLRQGDIAITPAGYSQQWRWLSPFAAANLFIPSLLIKEISKDLVKGDPDCVCLIEHKATAVPFLSALATELLSELEAGSPHGKTYIDALTHSLTMYLVVHFSTAKFEKSTALLKSDHTCVACAIDFIESHLGEDLTLAAIASACNVSINRLCAVFKHSTGQSAHQFVIQQRIERAKILLKTSKKPLVEIAQEIGFSNQAHFTTSFRKICGSTPSQYRQDFN
ncbi:helix-turn-helix transcriptional regulator [Leptolyngbya sp. FACHB-541]|uniref:helix-turn-helix domain-containing protein n=1 Tax=Leptolyngbya sp. FACHB-541 TaxID=2692810 RepID=UPI00168484B2|nr:AraC family transcriptional regulator [Leptolyngbya sp. FACHB-541]MBD1995665.1 helix-turn-helix transcriptional regulator [Leptolyngbya sp. FACHB-541]